MIIQNTKKKFSIFRKKYLVRFLRLFSQLTKDKAQSLYLYTIYQMKYGSSMAKPEKLLWIDPNLINHKLVPFFNNYVPDINKTYCIGDDWDTNKRETNKIYPQKYEKIPNKRTLVRVKDLDWYQSFDSHFNDGISWEETKLYHRRMREGFKTNRYNTEEGLQKRLNDIEQLYQYIASEGYKTQSALAQEDDIPIEASDWTHEVQVNIGRSGEFILDDGRNRLILAQILDVPKIPVRVLVRHKQWQEIRKDIHNNGFSEKYEEFRDHPDLQDVIS